MIKNKDNGDTDMTFEITIERGNGTSTSKHVTARCAADVANFWPEATKIVRRPALDHIAFPNHPTR
jgi:hypothetical protein